ncbi:hypothetical protein HYH03_017286 [Edaphochlamys debaryana]|uniref:Cap-specific mRNA (nucleoside-2'-O-)-methyltransferase 1 n=1 Tax=Edaphochlamys debaryana TaxID=47281 RepID=A0A835XIR4_9CHLO|nr:hypothetical protein HYH03_017286 [Edaphochlamys debaryana]|eukprot:KAG2483892.1 hypothetical protein HYH03_017286 [Edaphochlamys debaryana]
MGAGTSVPAILEADIRLLLEWQNLSKTYSWLHDHSSHMFHYVNLALVAPIILFSVGSGAYTLFFNVCSVAIVQRLIGVAGIAAGTLTTIYNILKLDRMQEYHRNAALDFQHLARDICLELHFFSSNPGQSRYANVSEFMKECINRYNTLVDNSPTIPKHVIYKLATRKHVRRTLGAEEFRTLTSDPPRPLSPGMSASQEISNNMDMVQLTLMGAYEPNRLAASPGQPGGRFLAGVNKHLKYMRPSNMFGRTSEHERAHPGVALFPRLLRAHHIRRLPCRSFFKLWESIADHRDLFTRLEREAPLTAVFLAEGPGGFVEAFCKYRSVHAAHARDRLYGMTLLSPNKSVPEWRIQGAASTHRGATFHMVAGADGSGDLYNIANVDALVVAAGAGYADVVTADGGFDFSGNFEMQEQLSLRLIAAEILCALQVQRTAADAVFFLKVYDLRLVETLVLLAILADCYDHVHVTKPLTSRPANSEKYIICTGFNGSIHHDPQTLRVLRDVVTTGDTSLLQRMAVQRLSGDMLRDIIYVNGVLTRTQIAHIGKTLALIAAYDGSDAHEQRRCMDDLMRAQVVASRACEEILVGTLDSLANRWMRQFFQPADYYTGVQEYGALLLEFLRSAGGTQIKETVKYLIVDEFQDLSRVQLDIVLEFDNGGSFIIAIEAAAFIQLQQRGPGGMAVLSRYKQALFNIEESLIKSNRCAPAQNGVIPFVTSASVGSVDSAPKRKPGHVTLMTLHQSKGLEWPLVILVLWDTDVMDEEWRLMYVAITRARDRLHIVSPSRAVTDAFLQRLSVSSPRGQLFAMSCDDSGAGRAQLWESSAVTANSEQLTWLTNPQLRPRFGVVHLIQSLTCEHIQEMRVGMLFPASRGSLRAAPGCRMRLLQFSRRADVFEDVKEGSAAAGQKNLDQEDEVDASGFQLEFGKFVDRFLTRMIWLAAGGGGAHELVDRDALTLLETVFLPREQLRICERYAHAVTAFLESKDMTPQDFVDLLDRLVQAGIDRDDIRSLTDVFARISMHCRHAATPLARIRLADGRAPMHVHELARLRRAYTTYTCAESKHAVYATFRVSLCSVLLKGRKSLWYHPDAYAWFRRKLPGLLPCVRRFVADLTTSVPPGCIRLKPLFTHRNLLHGEADLVTHDSVIDFKCSRRTQDFAWLAQCLSYVAMEGSGALNRVQAFIKDLIRSYPNAPEFKLTKGGYKVIKAVNIRYVQLYFRNTLGPYRDSVMRRDDSALLTSFTLSDDFTPVYRMMVPVFVSIDAFTLAAKRPRGAAYVLTNDDEFPTFTVNFSTEDWTPAECANYSAIQHCGVDYVVQYLADDERCARVREIIVSNNDEDDDEKDVGGDDPPGEPANPEPAGAIFKDDQMKCPACKGLVTATLASEGIKVGPAGAGPPTDKNVTILSVDSPTMTGSVIAVHGGDSGIPITIYDYLLKDIHKNVFNAHKGGFTNKHGFLFIMYVPADKQNLEVMSSAAVALRRWLMVAHALGGAGPCAEKMDKDKVICMTPGEQTYGVVVAADLKKKTGVTMLVKSATEGTEVREWSVLKVEEVKVISASNAFDKAKEQTRLLKRTGVIVTRGLIFACSHQVNFPLKFKDELGDQDAFDDFGNVGTPVLPLRGLPARRHAVAGRRVPSAYDITPRIPGDRMTCRWKGIYSPNGMDLTVDYDDHLDVSTAAVYVPLFVIGKLSIGNSIKNSEQLFVRLQNYSVCQRCGGNGRGLSTHRCLLLKREKVCLACCTAGVNNDDKLFCGTCKHVSMPHAGFDHTATMAPFMEPLRLLYALQYDEWTFNSEMRTFHAQNRQEDKRYDYGFNAFSGRADFEDIVVRVEIIESADVKYPSWNDKMFNMHIITQAQARKKKRALFIIWYSAQDQQLDLLILQVDMLKTAGKVNDRDMVDVKKMLEEAMKKRRTQLSLLDEKPTT